jgi:hypothetical protein
MNINLKKLNLVVVLPLLEFINHKRESGRGRGKNTYPFSATKIVVEASCECFLRASTSFGILEKGCGPHARSLLSSSSVVIEQFNHHIPSSRWQE